MNKNMILMTVTLLMAGSIAWAQSTDKSDTNPTGAGVVKTGNTVADVCECNASSAPLLPKEQYKHLLPDEALGKESSTQTPSNTSDGAKGTN